MRFGPRRDSPEDAPSLDHLRQQAKDVLPRLRAVRPGASLSDAQALVADQYGFRTWPDLKAEVDRRGRHLVHAGEEATAAVVAAFDLGAPTDPMAGLGQQWAGHAWVVGKVHAMRLPPPGPLVPWLTCVRPESRWRHLQEAAASVGKPWAEQLDQVIPTILDVSEIVEPAPAGDLVLSACHYAPNAFCVAGADDLAVMSWEHAGAIPPRWDFGVTLAPWSEGTGDRVNEAAARAVLAGYAAEYELPDPLDLGIFSAHVCAGLSWLASRIRIALTEADPEPREQADRAVPWLLKDPPSRARFEAVLDAASRR